MGFGCDPVHVNNGGNVEEMNPRQWVDFVINSSLSTMSVFL